MFHIFILHIRNVITKGQSLSFFYLKAPIDPTSSTIFTLGFALLGVGVVLLSLTAIGGLLYYKRKIGAYNFDVRPQQENFTYHVFDA